MDYTPLKSPIQTDPLNLGFAPLLAAGNYNAIAVICNDINSAGAGTVTLPTMSNQDFVTAFLPYLLPIESLTSTARIATYDRLWRAILAMPTINLSNANVSSFLSLAVSDKLLTQSQATALNQRKGTYAEVLCGAGAQPSGSDISALFHTPTN